MESGTELESSKNVLEEDDCQSSDRSFSTDLSGTRNNKELTSTSTSTSTSPSTLKYGHCRSLKGVDPLPSIAQHLFNKIKSVLSTRSMNYLHAEKDFFDSITDISAKLKTVKNKSHHPQIIAKSTAAIVSSLSINIDQLFLPTVPERYLLFYFVILYKIASVSRF